jgi:poly-gamma-glutamate capsule biosynthesis protein CapA/YwtB (metallophosphatase superfamily)
LLNKKFIAFFERCFQYVGTTLGDDMQKPLIVRGKGGLRIAVLAVRQPSNYNIRNSRFVHSIVRWWTAGQLEKRSRWAPSWFLYFDFKWAFFCIEPTNFDTHMQFHGATILADVQFARTVSDFVVVVMHWGSEYYSDISDNVFLAQTLFLCCWFLTFVLCSPQTLANARKVYESGADLVIGHHPHVLQGHSVVVDSGRSAFIAYRFGCLCGWFDRTYQFLKAFPGFPVRAILCLTVTCVASPTTRPWILKARRHVADYPQLCVRTLPMRCASLASTASTYRRSPFAQ